ncbi:MAG: hypothetical protein K940chlam3_00337 [Chlamydiae bacterium]|nr:hypothetical protein [Chlamydiota bacterium]
MINEKLTPTSSPLTGAKRKELDTANTQRKLREMIELAEDIFAITEDPRMDWIKNLAKTSLEETSSKVTTSQSSTEVLSFNKRKEPESVTPESVTDDCPASSKKHKSESLFYHYRHDYTEQSKKTVATYGKKIHQKARICSIAFRIFNFNFKGSILDKNGDISLGKNDFIKSINVISEFIKTINLDSSVSVIKIDDSVTLSQKDVKTLSETSTKCSTKNDCVCAYPSALLAEMIDTGEISWAYPREKITKEELKTFLNTYIYKITNRGTENLKKGDWKTFTGRTPESLIGDMPGSSPIFVIQKLGTEGRKITDYFTGDIRDQVSTACATEASPAGKISLINGLNSAIRPLLRDMHKMHASKGSKRLTTTHIYSKIKRQGAASQFPPETITLVLDYIEEITGQPLENITYFDGCGGWFDRGMAAIIEMMLKTKRVGRVVINDTNSYLIPRYKETIEFLTEQFPELRKDITIMNEAAEELDPDHLDFKANLILTSPPYFCAECYPGEKSSTRWLIKDEKGHINYKASFESWRDKFLIPMLDNFDTLLAKDGWMVINIDDVSLPKYRLNDEQIAELKKEKFLLEHDTSASCYFDLLSIVINFLQEKGYKNIKVGCLGIEKGGTRSKGVIKGEPIILAQKIVDAELAAPSIETTDPLMASLIELLGPVNLQFPSLRDTDSQ